MTQVTCPRCWGLGFDPPKFQLQCTYCKGIQFIEDYQLSPNFWFHEWAKARVGCPNEPGEDAVARARLTLTTLLEPARAVTGPLRVTSGYRCPELDVLADGGNTYWLTHKSAHAIGSAFDVQPTDKYIHLKFLFKTLVKQAKGPWDQLIAEGGCIHCAAEGPTGSQRNQVLIRRLRTKSDEPGWKFKYEVFNDTDSQWLSVV